MRSSPAITCVQHSKSENQHQPRRRRPHLISRIHRRENDGLDGPDALKVPQPRGVGGRHVHHQVVSVAAQRADALAEVGGGVLSWSGGRSGGDDKSSGGSGGGSGGVSRTGGGTGRCCWCSSLGLSEFGDEMSDVLSIKHTYIRYRGQCTTGSDRLGPAH